MSNINATIINENFPVPGVDNDTVGFRDNFATIKNNFVAAKAEIEALDSSTAKVNDPETSFRGNKVTDAVLQNNVTAVFNGGTLPSSEEATSNPETATTTDLSFSNGEYQYFSIAGLYTSAQTPRALVFNITDIPSTGFAKMILELRSGDGLSHNVTFGAGNLVIKKPSTFPNPLTIASSSNPTIIEISTRPGSGNVLLEFKGVFV
jgi:hypothetical protein